MVLNVAGDSLKVMQKTKFINLLLFYPNLLILEQHHTDSFNQHINAHQLDILQVQAQNNRTNNSELIAATRAKSSWRPDFFVAEAIAKTAISYERTRTNIHGTIYILQSKITQKPFSLKIYHHMTCNKLRNSFFLLR